MIQRPFSSGSRQAPDPHDNFLEEAGYYRKHTARDSSCLFRTISEQMYDTQTHYASVRTACVEYMRKNKEHFQYKIDKDIDDYLAELSKPKTFGTLLELGAMAYMYRRNVVLFRPMDRGTLWFSDQNFTDVFQIFISHEKHFDTVYTNEFIQDAAFCQSICYEILYKNVFKLPDVTYAVERMLHASSFEDIRMQPEYDGYYCRRITLDDGRTFEFDEPDNTSCILNKLEYCHFHNPDFLKLQKELSLTNDQLNDYDHNEYNNIYKHRFKAIDALLPDKYVSCVRQLLTESITPFPYKVAKALDPDMYRNIEFDSWSEKRKELRIKNWYTGGTTLQMYKSTRKLMHIMDIQHILQVGVKCQVNLAGHQSDEVLTGYIQEMSADTGRCIVFIEQLGKKLPVQLSCLKPLPPDQIKPWPLPYRLQKHFEKYNNGPTTKYLKRISHAKLKFEYECQSIEMEPYPYENHNYCHPLSHNNQDDIDLKLKRYCSMENFTPTSCDMITMPLKIEHHQRTSINGTTNNSRSASTPRLNNNPITATTVAAIENNGVVDRRPESSNGNQSEIFIDENNSICYEAPQFQNGVINYSTLEPPYGYEYVEPSYGFQYADNSIIHATPAGHSMIPNAAPQYYYVYPAATAAPAAVPHNVHMQPPPLTQTVYNGQQIANGYYQAHSSSYYATAITSANNNLSSSSSSTLNIENNTGINYSASKSLQENGTDLPHDTSTLRFFYNLGWEHYQELVKNGDGNIENDKEISNLSKEFHKNIKIENETQNQNNPDLNNNKLDINSNNQHPNSNQHCNSDRGCGSGHNKRFNARYFNNRKSQGGGGYRGGNNNGGGHYRYSSMNGHNKNNNRNNDYNNNKCNSSVGGGTPGINNQIGKCATIGKNANTNERNNTNGSSGTDQSNQTSPSSAINENNNEYVQTPPLYNVPHTTNGSTAVYTSFNPFIDGATNVDQQQQQNQTTGIQNNIVSNGNGGGGGVYVPHLMPMSFGMYTTATNTTCPPPGSQQSIIPGHNTNTSGGSVQYITTGPPPLPNHPPPPIPAQGIQISATSFPQPPPMQHPGSYYFAPTTTVTANNDQQQQNFITNDGGNGSADQQQYSVINYPTVYYSNGNGGAPPTPTGGYHQGYWYPTTAAPPPLIQPQTAPGAITPTTNLSKMNYSGNTSNISH